MVFLVSSKATPDVIKKATSSFIPPRTSGHFVVVLGAGVFGRRIACTWAAGGFDVHIHDPSPSERTAAVKYCSAHLAEYPSSPPRGTVYAMGDLALAVEHAWLVIETVPEELERKKTTFAALEKWAPRNAILCSTSAGFKCKEMAVGLKFETRRRMLTIHHDNTPASRVALRTDGEADKTIFPFLAERLEEIDMEPFITPSKRPKGKSFSRSWAAATRKVFGGNSAGEMRTRIYAKK